MDYGQILISVKDGITGLPTTLYMAVGSFILSFSCGLIVSIVRCYRIPFLNQLFSLVVNILKGVPQMAILLIIYLWGSKLIHLANIVIPFFNIDTSSINTVQMSLIGLAIVGTVKASEILRGSFYSVDEGQFEAGRSLGYSERQIYFTVILGQQLRIAIPMLGNLAIGLCKATTLTSVIGVVEVLQSSLTTANINFKFFEGYLAAAIISWGLAITIDLLIQLYNNKIQKV